MSNVAPDLEHMRRAIQLAERGQGHVEPNPMVGCVIVRDGREVGEGWHRRFGGPHAETEALHNAGDFAQGATMFVTLEPCCHSGKTPPCTRAVIEAGIRRVVIARSDPNPRVNGRGVQELSDAGVQVQIGIGAAEVDRLNAPYLKFMTTGRPWVVAKWAMTLDGRIASRTGSSRWISAESSRAIVHELRGRMDAILVGRGTVEADDPMLTARPPGPRVAVRVVADSQARISHQCQLVQSASQTPVWISVGPDASDENCHRLQNAGCQILRCDGQNDRDRLDSLLGELARRQITNVLVEGGAAILGCLFDSGSIDEVHVFVAPRLIGGHGAKGPIGGQGIAEMSAALQLESPTFKQCECDTYIHGRVAGR